MPKPRRGRGSSSKNQGSSKRSSSGDQRRGESSSSGDQQGRVKRSSSDDQGRGERSSSEDKVRGEGLKKDDPSREGGTEDDLSVGRRADDYDGESTTSGNDESVHHQFPTSASSKVPLNIIDVGGQGDDKVQLVVHVECEEMEEEDDYEEDEDEEEWRDLNDLDSKIARVVSLSRRRPYRRSTNS